MRISDWTSDVCSSDLRMIAGRTSAVSIAGVDDAVQRIAAYEAAGVDALFLIGVKTKAQLAALRAAVKLPLILGGDRPEIMDLDYLPGMGVRLWLPGPPHFMEAAGMPAVKVTC